MLVHSSFLVLTNLALMVIDSVPIDCDVESFYASGGPRLLALGGIVANFVPTLADFIRCPQDTDGTG